MSFNFFIFNYLHNQWQNNFESIIIIPNLKECSFRNMCSSGCLYSPAPGPLFGPDPAHGPQFVFTGPGTQFVFTDPGPQFAFTSPSPQFVFTCPGSQFVFTGPSLQFYYQSGVWIYIYQPCLLNLYLYLRPWPTICITGPWPGFALTLLLVKVAVVVAIVVVLISFEQDICMPILVN